MLETKWILRPAEGSLMEKINLPFFYELGGLLHPLSQMPLVSDNRINVLLNGLPLKGYINNLLSWSPELKVCRANAKPLVDAIDKASEWVGKATPEDWKKRDPVTERTFAEVVQKAKEFEAVLSAELQTLSAYYCTQKGIYSMSDLIDRAENVFPPSIVNKLSQSVLEEVKQGGRCLAFDNTTASGFHMLRATEAVLHEYYVHVCRTRSKTKLDNWGAYISVLHKLTEEDGVKADIKEHLKKVIALLQQIKDQDRNLIMHPEVVLTSNEAFTLFEITKGAIMAMSDKLPERKKARKHEQKVLTEAAS